jgi:hypothetical protein
MSLPKFFIESADPTVVKEVALLLGGLEGQLITVDAVATMAKLQGHESLSTLEGVRAFQKHLIEAAEPFLPGGQALIEELYDPEASPEVYVESVRRTLLWGRQSSLVLPVSLPAIEAGSMLSRMGTSFAYAPVTTLDQVAAILSVTAEASPQQVTLVVPAAAVDTEVHPLSAFAVAAMNLVRTAAPQGQVLLQVTNLTDFVDAVLAGVDAVAAPPEVFAAFVAAGTSIVPGGTDGEGAVELAAVPPVIDLKAPHQSFAISTPYTNAQLMDNLQTWQQLII